MLYHSECITTSWAGPDGSFGPLVARQCRVGSDVYHRGCAYTVPQTVQRPGYIIQSVLPPHEPAPMAHSVRLWLDNVESGRMFVIKIVHIQCPKLFKGLGCPVLSMVLCTIKNLWSHSIRIGYIPDFGLPSVVILPWLCRNPANTKHLYSIYTTSAQRLRRWSNIV